MQKHHFSTNMGDVVFAYIGMGHVYAPEEMTFFNLKSGFYALFSLNTSQNSFYPLRNPKVYLFFKTVDSS